MWEPQADLGYGEKIEVLRDYSVRYGLRTMIETGLYNGRGSGMEMQDLLDLYWIIDCDPEQVEAARSNGFFATCGDTGEMFGVFISGVFRPCLFWLDAHLVANADEENGSSLGGELDAILAWPHAAQSVVLIDDIRMMGREGWPTLAEVLSRCEPVWDVLVEADIVRCTPRV